MRILEKKRIGAPKCKKNISFTYYRKIHKLRVNYKLMLCNSYIHKRISCSCERKSCRRDKEVADVTEICRLDREDCKRDRKGCRRDREDCRRNRKVLDLTEKVADVTESCRRDRDFQT